LHQLPALPAAPVLIGLACIALVAIGKLPLPALSLLAFCWTGLVAQNELAARWPSAADGDDIELVGWIDGLPQREAGRTVFSLRVVDSPAEHAPRRVRLSWYEPVPLLVAGQAVSVEARIRSPRGLVNPGGFDYERWLLIEGYDATGYVRRGGPQPGWRFSLAQRWLELRAAIAAGITRDAHKPDGAALIRALALGERSGFGDHHWAVLQRSGTSHLVAVSGLHIGMIAALSFWLMRWLALRLPVAISLRAHSLAAILCLIPATVYAALAGFTLPTRRALVMLLCVQIFVILRRRAPLAGSLGLALIVILIADPLASLTASFWLSFGAVTVLLAASAEASPPMPATRSGHAAAAIGFCRLQLALTLGLTPLVIWFFGQASLASFFVNLVAIPVFGLLVVPLSLVAALAAAFNANPLGIVSAAGSVAELTWRALELAAKPQFAAFELPRPDLPTLLLAGVAIGCCIPRHRLPGRWLAALALLPLVLDRSPRPGPGYAEVTVLDVGHGLAVVVDTADHRILYDAGPMLRSGFDAGAEVVVPAVGALGSRPLDLLILSHGDSDHAGGAQSVIARYPGMRVMASPDVTGLAAEACRAGQSWQLDGVRFSVLHPSPGWVFPGNDSSCVVRVDTLAGSLLLTGDIEARAEASLAGADTLAADVVVVPHHGSATSSTSGFVRAVRPDVAIVSAAHNNRWNFPRPEVTQRWEEAGAIVLTTADQGAISVSLGPDGIALGGLRDARRRYWQARAPAVSGDFRATAL
jgi:competence protein ComEC